ncbi:MAG: pentalenene oxygenase [Gaiellaceae bacterium]|nr:pentalenene oxygenase [Gaiellaceae bacterium]
MLSARAFFRDPVEYVTAHADGHATIPLRAGPSRFLLVRDPELVWRVLVTDADSFVPGKWKRRARRFVGATLNTLSGDEHRRRRQVLQPPLDRRRIARFAPAIAARVEAADEQWRDGTTIRLRDTLDPLSLAVAGEVLLSTDLPPGLANDLSRTMAALPRLTPPVSATAGGRALARVERVVDELIDARRGAAEQDDLLGALLRAGLPGRVVRGETVAFLLAAVDEPPSALEAAWYLLGGHPEVERRLHAELDAREQSTYLDAVLLETLRLFPPARHIDRCPARDVMVGNVRLQKGANVLVSPLVTHADSRVYDRPSEFDPDRWLEGEDRARGAYLPFGAGAHTCIGEPLARAIMTTTLATLGRRWRLRVDPDAPPPIPRADRLVVTLQRR